MDASVTQGTSSFLAQLTRRSRKHSLTAIYAPSRQHEDIPRLIAVPDQEDMAVIPQTHNLHPMNMWFEDLPVK